MYTDNEQTEPGHAPKDCTFHMLWLEVATHWESIQLALVCSPSLRVMSVWFCYRSKRILGFQRKGHDKQTKLQWQGMASHSDTNGGDAEQNMGDSIGDDDAAMAAADNVDWNQF